MSVLTPFAQFIRQALLYPLFSPFLPPPEKVEKDFSYSAGQLKGTLEAPPEQGLPKTGQTIEYQLGDDGTYKKGYPLVPPRFVDNGDGTITDKATGLMWVASPTAAGLGGVYYWAAAVENCRVLNYAGHSDWRLPNLKELMSVVDYGKSVAPLIDTSFFVCVSGGYWSSTTYPLSVLLAYNVLFNTGAIANMTKTTSQQRIRPVRLGKP